MSMKGGLRKEFASFGLSKVALDYLDGLTNDTNTDNSWVPLVDGSEPPNFITDGAGGLIFVAYEP